MKNLCQKFTRKLSEVRNRFIQDESGADMVEYALILALVAIVASVGLHTLGNTVGNALNNISSQITSTI